MAVQLSALPDGACDTHVHVFGPAHEYPYAPERTYTPQDRPREDLFALHEALGVSRGVIVQPGCHGTDNRVTLGAIAARPEAYRGVALVAPGVAPAELARLDAGGIRGVRFNFLPHLGSAPDPDDLAALSGPLAEMEWHVLAHLDLATLDAVDAMLATGLTVVIDHMARCDPALPASDPQRQRLFALIDHPRCWIKVSGVDRISRQGPPYADGVALAAELIKRAPERVLWGTDWPHPNHPSPPSDDDLVSLIGQLAPDPGHRWALLVDNPDRLYRFDRMT